MVSFLTRPQWQLLQPVRATPTHGWWSCPRQKRVWASTSWEGKSRTPPSTSPEWFLGGWPTAREGWREETSCCLSTEWYEAQLDWDPLRVAALRLVYWNTSFWIHLDNKLTSFNTDWVSTPSTLGSWWSSEKIRRHKSLEMGRFYIMQSLVFSTLYYTKNYLYSIQVSAVSNY